MSDSASKKEVEDVLSSVRRLVSGEAPRIRRPSLPAISDALVLTDAQRVERPVSKGTVAKSLEDRIAELEAAVSSRADEYEPDGSEDQAQHRPDRIVYTRPPSAQQEAEMQSHAKRLSRLALVESLPDVTEVDAPKPEGPGTVTFRHDRGKRDPQTSDIPDREEEAPMAEDVIAPPREKAEVRRFHSPDDMVDRIEARLNGDAPSPSGQRNYGFSEWRETYRTPSTDPAPEPEQEVSVAAEIVSEIETVAEYSINSPDSGDAFSGEDENDDFEIALDEAVEGSLSSGGQGALEDAVMAAAIGKPDGVSDGVRGAIDEDVLRPIVARLIREELQGELGERITRNVRKLVRREILRALSAREFE